MNLEEHKKLHSLYGLPEEKHFGIIIVVVYSVPGTVLNIIQQALFSQQPYKVGTLFIFFTNEKTAQKG